MYLPVRPAERVSKGVRQVFHSYKTKRWKDELKDSLRWSVLHSPFIQWAFKATWELVKCSTVSLWFFLELCIQMEDNQIYDNLKTLGTIIKGKLVSVCIHFLKFVKWWRTRISAQWSLLQMLPLCNFFKNRFLYFWQLFKVITKALNEALQY